MSPPPESPSLRSELVRAFWGFGGLLILIFGAIVVGASIEQEDKLLKRQLGFELEAYVRHHQAALEQGIPPPVTSRFIRSHLGTQTLPDSLRELAADLPDGIHEIEKGIFQGEDFFLAIHSLPRRQERLYLVYDVRPLDEWLEFEAPSLRVVLIGGLAVAVLGLLGAFLLSRRVLAPVTDLEQVVSSHADPERLAAELAECPQPPELAPLSTALERSMRRIDAFIERERKFTRNASHELRTPVTVIRGAVELLEQAPDERQRERVVGRIRRSIDQMEDLIETFLWLAREDEDAGAADWDTDLEAIVRDVADHHRPLFDSRRVRLELAVESTVRVAAPYQAVSVVVANLVKNALHSSRGGRVRLEAAATEVRVRDAGPDPAGEPSGRSDQARGFGLPIVEELCRRFDWRWSLAPDPEGGTVATVDFDPSAAGAGPAIERR